MSARIVAEAHEFEVTVDDGWMSIHVQHHVAMAIVDALRDMVRALTWRDGPESMRLAAMHARMAYSLETDNSIRKMSYEDAWALLGVRGVRSSEIGKHIQLHAQTTPMNSSKMCDPVYADITAKSAESVMECVLEA